jgi:nucleoside-diphosphate-sugar epimerase
VSRAEREFGFRATTPLEIGLEETIAWYAMALHEDGGLTFCGG